MKRIELELHAGEVAALAGRDLVCIAAAMRYGKKPYEGPPDGFDVTIEHVSGKGPGVTGSGPTLLDALARATAAFERYARRHVEDRLAGRNPDARHTSSS